ncbi:hypothetical protein CP532_4135 [Ophiocordyceps camponoti-leonardi (nom. inval.)]|nr:hypothetical protein CP532_4135 [Ophiocordyceps camponoti-leonardi (nom. inval.)]
MARRLPWKLKAEQASPQRTPSPSPPTPAPRHDAITTKPTLPFSSPRSPSTSPPPEPPREKFMTRTDEGYRMVEDELLRTAHLFTIHLHRAEYDRQKAQAKAQHADTIREMERRPVVGDPSASARLRAVINSRDARQRAVLEEEEPSSSSLLPAKEHVAGLRRLMDCPRGQERSISAVRPPAHTNTRAAAGFRRPGVGVAHTSRRSSTASESGAGAAPTLASSGPVPSTEPPAAIKRDVEAGAQVRDDARKKRSTSETSEPDLSDEDPFSIKRRRLLRQRARDQQFKHREAGPSRKSLPDTIPSFL